MRCGASQAAHESKEWGVPGWSAHHYVRPTTAADPVPQDSAVNHPPHYGGADDPYEAIKVIDAWDLSFCLGSVLKYIRRCGRKAETPPLQDLEKARWYLDHEIVQQGGQSWNPK